MPGSEFGGARDETVVLIVDDDPDTLEILTELFEESGARVVTAERVAHAREVIERARHVDVVVTDYAMPGEDGLAFLAWLRARQGPALPVVMTSGHDTHGSIARAADEHGAELVKKPFSFEAILDAIGTARARAAGRVTG